GQPATRYTRAAPSTSSSAPSASSRPISTRDTPSQRACAAVTMPHCSAVSTLSAASALPLDMLRTYHCCIDVRTCRPRTPEVARSVKRAGRPGKRVPRPGKRAGRPGKRAAEAGKMSRGGREIEPRSRGRTADNSAQLTFELPGHHVRVYTNRPHTRHTRVKASPLMEVAPLASRTLLRVGRGLAGLSALVAVVVIIAGCGAPQFSYVADSSAQTYFKVPYGWHQISGTALSKELGSGSGAC